MEGNLGNATQMYASSCCRECSGEVPELLSGPGMETQRVRGDENFSSQLHCLANLSKNT